MNTAWAMTIGFALDLLIGDPARLPHPVAGIGLIIAWLEKGLRALFPARPAWEIVGGGILVCLTTGLAFVLPYFLLVQAYKIDAYAGLALESLFCFQILATKSLRDAGMRVRDALVSGSIESAREAVGHIVGRDVAGLDSRGVARAAVETVAENSSDGVVAPMLYFAVGGAPLAFAYKAINTMDSMLGYRNDRYLHFGRVAARMDDAANFIPARLTALLMLAASGILGLDWRNAARIYRRDRKNHGSPNSGQPEAACAGTLGIRLGGASSYGGVVVEKPFIGDPDREIEPEDIRRANRLLYATAFLAAVLLCGLRVLFSYGAEL